MKFLIIYLLFLLVNNISLFAQGDKKTIVEESLDIENFILNYKYTYYQGLFLFSKDEIDYWTFPDIERVNNVAVCNMLSKKYNLGITIPIEIVIKQDTLFQSSILWKGKKVDYFGLESDIYFRYKWEVFDEPKTHHKDQEFNIIIREDDGMIKSLKCIDSSRICIKNIYNSKNQISVSEVYDDNSMCLLEKGELIMVEEEKIDTLVLSITDFENNEEIIQVDVTPAKHVKHGLWKYYYPCGDILQEEKYFRGEKVKN